MRLKVSESKNAKSLYVIKSIYNKKTKSNTSKVVEKLGTYEDLKGKLNGEDPIAWAKQYIEELNKKEEEQTREILVKYSPVKQLQKEHQSSFNIGYLFLQQLYHQLGLKKITEEVSKRHRVEYNLDSILSRLIYTRILSPGSKLSTFELSSRFLEEPEFELHQIYRALEILCTESDFIQAQLYKNSAKVLKRNTKVLYYDCTNYYFETESAEGLKQYGMSKEHRPNPIVQMGLFMDADGIPLAFNIQEGNTNEQGTLKPLEKKILQDFDLSHFIVCTDAGLSSLENRQYNDIQGRSFITTQSIKKLPGFIKEWALDKTQWHLAGQTKLFNLESLDEEKYKDQIFYKERWIKEKDLEQKLIITYSIKYRNYQRAIREGQIERAGRLIESNPNKTKKAKRTDYKRLIKEDHVTNQGEVASAVKLSFDQDKVDYEKGFDGFYAVCTNLEDDAAEIARINKMRWRVEECFRIMKSELKARPVYLSRDDRIKAHFLTCFMALLIYRVLEQKLNLDYSCHEIINTLREMNMMKTELEDYIPTYTRTDLTDQLHDAFNFRTDFQIISKQTMKNILKHTKSEKVR